jgi:DNA repair protein RadA/Sms
MLAAVLSSVNDRPTRDKTLICGEIGLTGEIRAVAQADKRAMEASRMGLSSIILPSGNKRQLEGITLPDNFELYFVDKLQEAIDIIFS